MRASLERLEENTYFESFSWAGKAGMLLRTDFVPIRGFCLRLLQAYSSRVIFMFAQAIGDDGGDDAMDMTINESRRWVWPN